MGMEHNLLFVRQAYYSLFRQVIAVFILIIIQYCVMQPDDTNVSRSAMRPFHVKKWVP
jgi:hypothetical protein